MAAGCGKDSKGTDKDGKSGTSKMTAGPKRDAVMNAKKAFAKDSKDANACRSLAQSWIAYGSPDAPKKAGDPVKIPKDRDSSLDEATKVLEECVKLDAKDESSRQMLASVYMARGKSKEAVPLLKQIATDRKKDANSYYAWGLAESGAGNTKGTIDAWKMFVKYADKKDPRVKQTKISIKALEDQLKLDAKTAKAAAADEKSDDK